MTWLHVRPLVSTVTPEGGFGVVVPMKVGDPPLAWLPLTIRAIGAGVTVKSSGALV